MTKLEDEPYSNRFQKKAVEFLHRRTKATAVQSCNNSNIKAFLTYGILGTNWPQLGPYEVDTVTPLPNSNEFQCRVTFTADWTEVDFEENDSN